MPTLLANEDKIHRIKEVYGDRIPGAQWFLLGDDDSTYQQYSGLVSMIMFGGRKLDPGDQDVVRATEQEIKGQALLRICNAAILRTELVIDGKTYPLFKVGRDTPLNVADAPQPVITFLA